MSSLERRALAAVYAAAITSGGAGCGVVSDTTPAVVADSAHERVTAAVVPPRLPLTLDTSRKFVLEIWPLVIAPSRQLDETRRIVEHLQADLSLVQGFERATLLASGDGASLLLVAAWRDDGSADRGRASLAAWLRAETDTALLRRRLGTITPRVVVRRTVGMPPVLNDAAMLVFTSYALKPGHSFGALAALSDSHLAMRVLQDTAAQGGAMLVAADSGALYTLLQARAGAALGPELRTNSRLPFWAPFAARAEQLLAVIAVVARR